MSEYIIEIPDEYFASYDTKRDMYYPDERDSAMPITPIVRCRDCKHWQPWMKGVEPECWANGEPFSTPPEGFCAWGERK